MTTHSSSLILAMAAALAAAITVPSFGAPTAGEVFVSNSELISNTNCVDVAGFCFAVGRADSSIGGDEVGFSKARLLAQAKILGRIVDGADWPDDMTGEIRLMAGRLLHARLASSHIVGIETVFERKESPGHYVAVVAISESALKRARPLKGDLSAAIEDAVRQAGLAVRRQESAGDAVETTAWHENRGYWESDGIKCNETLDESDFL